ncbi:MAG: FAD:protein FMN transferase [Anaerolineales bacterium]
MHRFEFRAMGTEVLVAVDNDEATVGAQLSRVPGWFEGWEQVFSRFRSDSELSRLNQSNGAPFSASMDLWEVVHLALENARQSQGLVSPAILPALEYAGYVSSFKEMAKIQFNAFTEFSLEPPPAETIRTDPISRTITLLEGARIDLGGVAKGWAAHQTAKRLSPLGAVMVDAGGDIAVDIPTGESQGWLIDVKDPRDSATLHTIELGRGGIATSGRDRRQWQLNGRVQHHIIDPRSGLPAETGVLTATVIAPTVMEAEMAAKTVLILGVDAGLEWLEQRVDCAGLIVPEHGSVTSTSVFEKYMKARTWN